ncbi:MAG: twin-arginine translocase TatA/TatE family subunit, partial [Kiritimatiellae bacterium]|nr:twin-arginine translocase TatA/TatE family subunit [Kiritimatiellia bacterium]
MAFAFILDSVGAGEWFVLLAVLLVVMGPKRLPATARTIGSYYSKFRRAAETFKRQLMDMDWEMERELERAKREA